MIIRKLWQVYDSWPWANVSNSVVERLIIRSQCMVDLGNLEACYITFIWKLWIKCWSLGDLKAHSEALRPDLPFLRKKFRVLEPPTAVVSKRPTAFIIENLPAIEFNLDIINWKCSNFDDCLTSSEMSPSETFITRLNCPRDCWVVFFQIFIHKQLRSFWSESLRRTDCSANELE